MTLVQLASFVLNIGTALLMGIAIGMERQFRRDPAVLRTNALVCVGAALFVSLSGMVAHDASRTRIAAAVVAGIGFLGGGVILREGMNVKGMNTAATLWCRAAVGSLAGAGFPLQGLLGTAAVLLLHFTLRPVIGGLFGLSRKGVLMRQRFEATGQANGEPRKHQRNAVRRDLQTARQFSGGSTARGVGQLVGRLS